MRTDDELAQIVAMEQALRDVPDWAQRIVETSIRFLPPCGHYLFPRAYLEAVTAIGSETPPAFVHGCYTVERERKELMTSYLFCLDAWLGGVNPDAAAGELLARKCDGPDWPTICSELWRVLGQRTETKELLVEAALHRHRWWLKSTVWDDDARDVFCRDQYLGDIHRKADHYGNPDFCDPWFGYERSRRIEWVQAKLTEICPDWEWFRNVIEWSWLCGPKAFRFLEKLLWCIGKERQAAGLPSYPLQNADDIPGFLQCEDAYPNPQEAGQWWRSFLAALRVWCGGRATGEVADDLAGRLGEPTPVKRWLVRLLIRKCELYGGQDEGLGRLLRPRAGSKRGAGLVE